MQTDAILIAGGGTGGHLYPGFAVADEIRRRRPGIPLLFVGTRAGLEARLVPRHGYPLRFIRSSGIAGKSWLRRLSGALLVPVSLVQGGRIVIGERARVVVGVGGYASGPVVLAARLLGRPTLILEQNAQPGATNRLLAPLVDRVAVAFPATARRVRGRTVVTGNPVRPEIASRADERPASPLRVLVFGGSRGALGLNRAVCAALPALASSGLPLSIVHQTGEVGLPEASQAYAGAGVHARVVPYLDDMPAEYAAAHLVVCRAGATSVAELSAAGRASILVPLPHSVGGHQEENARQMEERGAALLLREQDAGAGRLAALILELAADSGRRRRMEDAARALGAPGAASQVADLVLELYDGRAPRAIASQENPA
jgi:UDP-N-acetylglucosamine--N-acetylmuramyl-(pentapeptide) pyrophosphoryl-undecaprenol N-acetylglucosamine transferase